ncbi:MAG: FKBP-type peptidyl-prolyl cis-trans isomerase [Bacteroidales bacterium]|nr:FKBP-type peptidyl-prolyl cis-trans isomerase [Bacteroidales bacterium]
MRSVGYKSILLAGIIISLISLGSCKDDEIDYEQIEREEIDYYLSKNNITTEPTASGLYYIELIEGTGLRPVLSDTVDVLYTGMFLNGTVFDSNIGGKLLNFPLGERFVIDGWDEGLSYMNEGGRAMLIIPSSLGYGDTGNGSIPGYTPLVFEVQLVNVIPGPNH